MAFDKRSNFAYSTIKVAPVPATSGTTLSVQTGEGALFNATPPYNAIVFPSNANPTKANAEIVRITAISTDTFTITRTQESTTARTIATGDQIMAGLTDKALSDIEAALNTNTGNITTNTSSISTINNLLNGTNTGVTLNQPTITDFTNAQHTHATASQGGSLGTGVVQGASLATSAITLGYAQNTGNNAFTSATYVQVTGLTTAVTIPAGGRRVKITVFCWALTTSTSAFVNVSIWDGTVGSGTEITEAEIQLSTQSPLYFAGVTTPSAGSKTYNVGIKTTAGTATFSAKANAPAYILVEAI